MASLQGSEANAKLPYSIILYSCLYKYYAKLKHSQKIFKKTCFITLFTISVKFGILITQRTFKC